MSALGGRELRKPIQCDVHQFHGRQLYICDDLVDLRRCQSEAQELVSTALAERRQNVEDLNDLIDREMVDNQVRQYHRFRASKSLREKVFKLLLIEFIQTSVCFASRYAP